MNYLEELESKLHPAFIALESNVEYKKYCPISYMKMLEEICHHYGWRIQGNRHLEALDVKNDIPLSRGTLVRRYDFNTYVPSVWIKDPYGRWFKWDIYKETDDGYYIRYMDMETMVNKKELYTEIKDGVTFTKCFRIIEIPMRSMRFNLTFLQNSGNVDYELEKRLEMLARGLNPGDK